MTPSRVTLHQPKPGTLCDGAVPRIYYGQAFTGRTFEHVEFVDPPISAADWQWLQEHLVPRLAPGATFCGTLAPPIRFYQYEPPPSPPELAHDKTVILCAGYQSGPICQNCYQPWPCPTKQKDGQTP